MRYFQVRDISEYYDEDKFENRYDIVFHDEVNRIVRYSPDVFEHHSAALRFCNRLELAKPQPEHYEWESTGITIDK